MTNIFVAVSGGVDSSVALALLRDAGYDVTGVYFKTYKPKITELKSIEYCRQQGMDAQAVCEHLGVPFRVFDLQEEYKREVFEYMIDGYRAGVTPNPDIMCNREIKFGEFAKRAFSEGADMIATGHYAKVVSGRLYMSSDQSKDQTYFLSQVRPEILSRSIFPLGELCKSEVRKLSEQYGLLTAHKKESQGICFIGQEINVKEFLREYIPEQEGDVLNIDGDVIGKHKGARYSTVGERHGFTILPEYQGTDMPRLYVIKRDIEHNTLTVGTREDLDNAIQQSKSITITNCNWLSDKPKNDKEYKCRIRHRGELYTCKVVNLDNGKLDIRFVEIPYAPAAGQFVALYDNDMCIGGGVIE
jgi:tRNA-specific 2-thiouridylase